MGKLVLYNSDAGFGIGSCKIGGGDFILQKGYEDDVRTPQNIIKKMKLTAARNFLKVSLEHYIELIRKEFVQKTYYNFIEERDPSILINWKFRVPMNTEEIEAGIQLGLKLRQ